LQHGGERGSEYVSLQGKALIGILAHMWGLPVFVLDTAGLDADAVRAAGASEFLRLPFTFETLVAAMRRQLGWGIADSAFAWWRGLASTSGAVGGRPSRL
jgi:hypothetical protein